MNKLFHLLHYLFEIFSRIVTGVTFVTAVYIVIFWGDDTNLSVAILWQILLVSALCSLGTLLLYNYEEKNISKKSMFLRTCIAFAYVNVIVLASGWYFQWFSFQNWEMVAGMEVCIIGVFLSITIISMLTAQKTADAMNARLKERDTK